MNEDELERWTSLVVAEAHGDALAPADRAARARIERSDPPLRSEASLWAEFAELAGPRAGEREAAELSAAVIATHALQQAGHEHADERGDAAMIAAVLDAHAQPRHAWLGVALALAACVALGVGLSTLRHGAGEARERERSGERAAAMTRSDLPEPRIATPGQHRLAHDECRRVGASARVCARDAVRLALAAESSDERVVLALEAGALELDASDPLTTIELTSAAGHLRVAGGRVLVRFDPIGETLELEVLAGEVEVVRIGSPAFRLGLGATLSLVAAAPPEPLVLAEAPTPAAAPTPAPTSPRPRARSKPSADSRLGAAQDALARGDAEAAIGHYETLIAEFPTSPTAAIARVSLGRLRLRRGEARDALAAFDAYLAGSERELAEEAEYGRIKALHALGRTGELAAAIDAFAAAHPDSIHRTKLDSLRRELEGSASDRP